MKKNIFLLALIFCLQFLIKAYPDDNITFFDENFTISFFSKYNMGIFEDFDSSQYRTDRPFDIGFGIRYKKFSAQVSVSISTEELFSTNVFDFEINSYFDNIYFETYFKSYPHLYVEGTNIQSEMSIYSLGIMATFVHNHRNHFLSSVIEMDKKQNNSSGSLLYGFGIFHSSINSTNEAIKKFNEEQHLLYFGPSIGYSYTWVFGNGIFLNTSLVLFANPGININNSKLLFIPKFEPKIVFGHHSNTWSINLKMMDYSAFIIWDKGDFDILTFVSVTIMFSKRF
jgi:hypothetical protein